MPGNNRGEADRAAHQLEQIKARAEAKAAEYHSEAIAMEARIRQERAVSQPVSATPQASPDSAASETQNGPPARRPTAIAAPGSLRAGDDAESRNRRAATWDDTSSWLTSAIVHLILILVLGILTLTIAEDSSVTELMASIDAGEVFEVDDFEMDQAPQETELDEQQALDVKIDDPGLAKLGEAVSAGADAVADVGTVRLAETHGEIGALFGHDGKGWASAGDGTGGATFFGVKAGGNRFAFVVDASSSMRRNGWEACKREILAAVSRLKPTQFFYVILFNNRPHRMFSDESPAPRPVLATTENICKLQKWVESFQLGSGTMPKQSMEIALKMRPDAIYFLTDGKIHDDTEEYLKQSNKRKDPYDNTVRKADVQTIGFYTEDGRAVLERIAKDNGGTFRYVTRPADEEPPKRGGIANPRRGRGPAPNRARQRRNR